tara:strand:+ start:355 stop:756 length:402 start_codon:yes stop_codon:yes gene_type:complete
MSTIKANTLLAADGSTTTQPSIPALDTRFATAWLLYDGTVVAGTSTDAILASYNISSTTNLSEGRHYINFINNMASDNYVTVASGLTTRSGTNRVASAVPNTASRCYVNTTVTSSGANDDLAFTSLVVFGGQA